MTSVSTSVMSTNNPDYRDPPQRKTDAHIQGLLQEAQRQGNARARMEAQEIKDRKASAAANKAWEDEQLMKHRAIIEELEERIALLQN
jgi:hypothetical protein